MEKICFVTTGGTIDKDYATTRGSRSLSIGDPSFYRILDELPHVGFDVESVEVCRVDSLDMTDSEREDILSAIQDCSERNVVVTHGTDSIIETATFLDGEVNSKSVVMVGSSRPEVFKGSDARFNLGSAVGAVLTLSRGVRICMHGGIHKPDSVRKTEDGSFAEIYSNEDE